MSPITPPTAAAPAPLPMTTAPTATVANAPAALTNMPAGSTLDATVLATLSRGEARVSTQAGTFVLKTPLDLPQGGQLSLQLLSTVKGQAVLKMAALNGRSLTGIGPAGGGAGGAQGTQATPGSAGPSGSTGRPGAPGPATAAGQAAGSQGGDAVRLSATSSGRPLGIHGTVVRAVAQAQPAAGQTAIPALPVGSSLTVRVVQIGAPAAGTGPGTIAGGPGQAAGLHGGPSPAGDGLAGGPGGAGARGSFATPTAPPGVPPAGQGAASGGPAGSGNGPGQPANPSQGSGTGAAQGESQTGPAGRTSPFTAPQNRTGAGAAATPPGARAAQAAPAPQLQTPALPPGSDSLAGRTLAGTVVSSGARAHPVVHTDAGLLALRTRLDAPPGTPLTLRVMAPPTPPASTAAPAAGPATALPPAGPPPLTPGVGWPAMTEGLELLNRTDPQAAAQLRNALPQPSPTLGAAVTSFIGSMRTGGDPARWPGQEAMKVLERSGRRGSELAGRIGKDLRDLAGRVQESPNGEWRGFTVPMLDAGTIDPIRVVLRRPPDDADEEGEKGGKGKKQGQRFLIDLEMSRLGPLQFDGLYSKGTRSIDVVLRGPRPLEKDHRRAIQVLFNTAMHHMAMTGAITFETTSAFVRPLPPDDPTAPPPPPDHGGTGSVIA